MNERFNQLLKQVEEETNAEYQDESRRKRRLYNEILLPKFAELIIKRCRDIVSDTRDQAIEEEWNVDEAMSTAMYDIEEYFRQN
jgi:hypothetical protein